ncbi:MAG: hypothetical protein R3327_06135 [Nitrosopumilaceae archaeon]|nr:hypothetical protein [Nitrosopumilaceae archaeon]
MSPKERRTLQKIDDIIMNASAEELKKIQDADIRTQLDGVSFYDVYVNSENLIQSILEQESRKYTK